MARSVLAVLGESHCVPRYGGGRQPVGHPFPDNKVLVQALEPDSGESGLQPPVIEKLTPSSLDRTNPHSIPKGLN